MQRLSELCSGRDNNLNLVRLTAAWSVLTSHSFIIVSGDPKREPLALWLGVTPGSLAVDAFFFLSGLLVTSSLMSSSTSGWHRLKRYVLARVMRIFPAAIVMSLATAIVLGVWFSRLDFASYAAHEQTWTYLRKNCTLLWGTTGNLPGVFAEAPYPRVVNGSLWTLPWELRMYIGLLGTWLLACLFGARRKRAFALAVLFIAAFALAAHLHTLVDEGVVDHRRRFVFLFFSGSAIWLFRDKVLLSGRVTALLLLVLGLSTLNKPVFSVIYQPILIYTALWFAYVPRGKIRRFNRLGDYSYGT